MAENREVSRGNRDHYRVAYTFGLSSIFSALYSSDGQKIVANDDRCSSNFLCH